MREWNTEKNQLDATEASSVASNWLRLTRYSGNRRVKRTVRKTWNLSWSYSEPDMKVR